MENSLDHSGGIASPKTNRLMQGLMRLIYPPLCISCSAETQSEQGLCSACWSDTYFITGAICDSCGQPVPGQDETEAVYCDGCLHHPPAWHKGRAAVVYNGGGRRISLALKHGDRLDVVGPICNWMGVSGRDVLVDVDLMAPVPLHWTRLLKRRYNQAALISNRLAKRHGIATLPDLLTRHKRTVMQKGMTREDRFENQAAAIDVTPRFRPTVSGKSILLIDDVMTTGATLSACAEACLAAGAKSVNILVFARVAREP